MSYTIDIEASTEEFYSNCFIIFLFWRFCQSLFKTNIVCEEVDILWHLIENYAQNNCWKETIKVNLQSMHLAITMDFLNECNCEISKTLQRNVHVCYKKASSC